MSKKVQKKETQKKQIEIVDQQKDPMLRALQKKVRNINKKLNEITQLSAKKDLKPEQEEKISKKGQIAQQKEKYLQMIEVYKEIAGESEKIIRKTQLNELEDLAAVIAAKEYQLDLGFQLNQNVDNLVRVLTSPTSGQLTLKQRIDQIYEALAFSANNTKLKKNIKQSIQANTDKKKQVSGGVSNQPEPLSSQSQQEREEELKQLQAEEKAKEIAKEVELQKPTLAQAPQPTVVAAPVAEVPASVLTQAPQVTESQPEKVQPKEATVTKVEENGATAQNKEKAPEGDAAKNEKRGYRGYRGREKGPRGDKYQGDKYQGDEQRPYKKRSFKPKYEGEQQPNQTQKDRRQSSSSSSSDSQPKARQFKREEVRELIEDGFIVVGKPKVKAREQKEYYDHQHGKKHHHHQSKKNY